MCSLVFSLLYSDAVVVVVVVVALCCYLDLRAAGHYFYLKKGLRS
jgi:hypothetical protein